MPGLHTAAKLNNVSAMQLLLDAGADVDAKEEGDTALNVGVRHRSVEASQYLLEHGANVNAISRYGQTPRASCRPSTERSDAMSELLDAHGGVM